MSLPTPFDPRLGTLLNQVGLSDNPMEAMNSLAFIRGTISRIQSIGLKIGKDHNGYLCITTTDPENVHIVWHGREFGWVAYADTQGAGQPEPVSVDFLKVHLIAHFG